MVRALNFWIQEEDGFYYLCSETKALISSMVTAQLICAFFSHMQKSPGFLMTWLKYGWGFIREVAYIRMNTVQVQGSLNYMAVLA